jgi:hypothetical protein
MNFIPNTNSTQSSGTASAVPGERAPANHLQSHDFEPNLKVRTISKVHLPLRHRQVKRIAVRLASLSPQSDPYPGVRPSSVRKSLTLNPEIKSQTD